MKTGAMADGIVVGGLTRGDVESGMPTLVVKELQLAGRELVKVDAAQALEDHPGRVGQPSRRRHVFADLGEATKVGTIDIDEPEIGRKAVGGGGRETNLGE